MYTAKKGTMYPVKRFVLELEQEKSVEAFLKLDAKIWTTFLKQQKGFVSKQERKGLCTGRLFSADS